MFFFKLKNISNNKIIICVIYIIFPYLPVYIKKTQFLSSYLSNIQSNTIGINIRFKNNFKMKFDYWPGDFVTGGYLFHIIILFSRVASCQVRPKQILSKFTLSLLGSNIDAWEHQVVNKYSMSAFMKHSERLLSCELFKNGILLNGKKSHQR